MDKIQFDRTSFDGTSLSKEELESWFDENFKISNEIKNRMNKIHRKSRKNIESLLREIENNVHTIVLLSPEKLKEWVARIDTDYSNVFTQTSKNKKTTSTRLGEQVLKAFNYKNYRKSKLVELAKKLNVKCCPYCNMHYTLYAEEGRKKSDNLAKLQFDHFFSEKRYPMLSMSLYNLIPSCAVCNQGKSDKKLSLSFHPYYSDICKQFKFELNNPIGLLSGEKTNDLIDVNFIAKDTNHQSELETFIQTFHLKALYQRHGDIAQETFDKAYEFPYYSNPSNFNWLSHRSPEYIKRLWMGTYTNENEIEKRPLSKFKQDLWEQAIGIKVLPEDTSEL